MRVKKDLIISDSREKFPFELELYGFNTISQALQTGDYSVSGMEDFLSIDRKASVEELVSNLFYDYKRFKKEMIRASEIKHFFLLCEFPSVYIDIFPNGTKIPKRKWEGLRATPKGIRTKLKYLYLDYGVKTILCSNRNSAEETCANLLRMVLNNEDLSSVDFYKGWEIDLKDS